MPVVEHGQNAQSRPYMHVLPTTKLWRMAEAMLDAILRPAQLKKLVSFQSHTVCDMNARLKVDWISAVMSGIRGEITYCIIGFHPIIRHDLKDHCYDP